MPRKKAETAEKPEEDVETILARLPNKENLTTRDVRIALRVHEVTVFRWVQKGLLKSHRLGSSRGRRSLYRRGDVETFIRLRCSGSSGGNEHADDDGTGDPTGSPKGSGAAD